MAGPYIVLSEKMAEFLQEDSAGLSTAEKDAIRALIDAVDDAGPFPQSSVTDLVTDLAAKLAAQAAMPATDPLPTGFYTVTDSGAHTFTTISAGTVWVVSHIGSGAAASVTPYTAATPISIASGETRLIYAPAADSYVNILMPAASGTLATGALPVNAYAVGDSPVSLSTTNDGRVLVDASGGDVTLVLPASHANTAAFEIIRTDNTPAYKIYITTADADTIDGETSQYLNGLEAVGVRSDGTNWYLY